MVGELCGPLKDQGFQEGINPFLLPETNLVIEEVQVFFGVFVPVVGSPVGDIPKEGEDGPWVISSNHLEGVSISLSIDLLIFGFKDNPQSTHTVHGFPELLLKLLEIHPFLQKMERQFQNSLAPFEDLLEHIHRTSPPGSFTKKTFTILWMVRFILLGWNPYDKFTLTCTCKFRGLAKRARDNTINKVMRMEKEKYQNIPGLDEVRTWIEEYVKKVANLRDQRGQEIELLYLRDRIEEWLSFYGSKGAFVDPEKTRVGNFDALLEKQGSLLVKMLDKKRFEEERKKIKPSKERWWWWIDERVKREKIMKLRRQMALLGIVIAALLSLYFLVFRLPPTEKKYLDALSRAEQLMDAGRWTEAIAACEEAIAIFPDRPNPYVIIGCIREKLGEENQAQEIFSQVELLYAKRVDFLLEKALWYFRLGMTDRSLATLSELLKEDPENLSALNLLGSVYEAENRVVEAIKVYERLLELAEKKEDLNLIPIAKMKIGMLQLKLPLTLP